MGKGAKYKCPECGKVIQSMHRHDYVVCGCPNKATVDGGSDYCRMLWVNKAPEPVKEKPDEQ